MSSDVPDIEDAQTVDINADDDDDVRGSDNDHMSFYFENYKDTTLEPEADDEDFDLHEYNVAEKFSKIGVSRL